jgi:serine protease Do
VTRAYLGVRLDPDFNAVAAERLKLDRVRGARVLEVYANTPASRANLKNDDVVLKFDGVEVLDEHHLINLVSLTPVGRKVKLDVFREGRHLTIEVNVVELDKERAAAPTQPGMGTHVQTLGLTVHTLETDIASQLGLDTASRGLLVLKIDRQGPMAGEMQLYDLIEEVARRPVASVADLEAALEASEDSETVLMTVKRRSGGQTQSEVVVFHR